MPCAGKKIAENSLSVGTDANDGYLMPNEFKRTLIEALEEQNIFRQLVRIIQTASGDHIIPVVATKGTASWVEEEGEIPAGEMHCERIRPAHRGQGGRSVLHGRRHEKAHRHSRRDGWCTGRQDDRLRGRHYTG